jgi:hypothetical protein
MMNYDLKHVLSNEIWKVDILHMFNLYIPLWRDFIILFESKKQSFLQDLYYNTKIKNNYQCISLLKNHLYISCIQVC